MAEAGLRAGMSWRGVGRDGVESDQQRKARAYRLDDLEVLSRPLGVVLFLLSSSFALAVIALWFRRAVVG
jgi:hypothetical protein